MKEKKENYVRSKLIRFSDQHAVIEIDDGQKINWPIKNLPDDIKEGDIFRLAVSTSSTEEEERKKTAKEIINQILND